MGEAALGNCVCVKFDILHFVLHGLAVRVQQVVSVVLDFDDVVVVQVDNLLRVHDNCRNVGGEVEFVLSDAQNKRRSAAGADEGAGFALADDGEAERTFDERNGFQYSFFQVALVVAGNQVGDHFSIGLGLEFDSFSLQLLFQDGVVLDNAVVDNRDVAVKALVRVCVFDGRGAVGGPAGVRDTDMSLDRVILDLRFKRTDFSGGTNGLYLSTIDKGDSRAVVAAVFKFLKSTNQDR